MTLLAYTLTINLVRELRPVYDTLRRHDADLAKQARRALDSVALNLAEGSGRTGRDQLHHYGIAFSSMREADAALDLAEANGYIDELPAKAHRERIRKLISGLRRG